MDVEEQARLILVIEDQRDHLEVIERVFAQSQVSCQIEAIASTADGLAYLRRHGEYAHATRPDIILIDIGRLETEGEQFISAIKTDSQLRRIPTIVLTRLGDDDDILKSYQAHCNSYIIKPSDLNQLGEVVRSIESFWLNIVTLPVE